MILTPDLIKLRLKQLGIRADKFLGQHFLIDSTILKVIQETAQSFIRAEDTIVEVGPGLGVLTGELVQFPNPVIAVEKDPVFAQELARFLDHPRNLEVLPGDILQKLESESELSTLAHWVVVANIPYAITSPLLRLLLLHPNPPHHILVLVQKEVAERVTAKPGNSARGLLTITVEVVAEAEIVQTVSPSAFWPAPEVESALLLLTRRPKSLIDPSQLASFRRVVIAGFSAKRKQLGNSLTGGLGLPAETIRSMLEQAAIDPTRRAETLTLDEWRVLAQLVEKH